ncbi:MAG: hypothetical protein M1818_001144 [Claussenomyces sp. TS43310]|nr:MAG: hypothetical protein M1818_001144 [Claussenomyces sp. TS43310]
MSTIKTIKSWTIEESGKGPDAMKWNENAALPELGDNDVLIKFHAASINYRDIAITLGSYPWPVKAHVVPGSDGAGEVVATGPKVSQFKKGDKVVTLFNQGHLDGSLTQDSIKTGLGGSLDGTLRQAGVFPEHGLVSMPQSLNYLEASTLSCAALTAWNALFGLKPLKAGETVLTQGTGGVSLFAVQFAKASGATVIATTSSAEKTAVLKKLGADHVINYKEIPEWGEKAKSLTPSGQGVNHIVEVGGPATLAQSLKAIQIDGIISIIGFVGGDAKEQPSFLECLSSVCTVRGLLVGSKAMFEDMNACIEANQIKPVIDKTVFKLQDLKKAFEHQRKQQHLGKVCLSID